MASWADLDAELVLWRAGGEVPTFWWRDDDTEAPTAALDRLISIAESVGQPLHLAVVPKQIDAGLAPRLRASPLVHVLQHGFAHINHEAKGTGASEVGVTRDISLQIDDLREGWRRLLRADLPQLVPMLVPPWNRIAETTLPHLPGLGYAAVSTFYRRPHPAPVKGLQHFHCHIDPIRWKEGARFSGTEKTLEQCVLHLRQRRLGDAEKDEPTGFVSHHLQTDEDTWDFMAAFLARLTQNGATRWLRIADVLKES